MFSRSLVRQLRFHKPVLGIVAQGGMFQAARHLNYVHTSKSLGETWDESVKCNGDSPAFGTIPANGKHYEWMTYQDSDKVMRKAVAALAAAGVSKGDRVAVIAGNRWEWAVFSYAAYKLGAVWVC